MVVWEGMQQTTKVPLQLKASSKFNKHETIETDKAICGKIAVVGKNNKISMTITLSQLLTITGGTVGGVVGVVGVVSLLTITIHLKH